MTWDVSFRGLFVETQNPEPVRRLLRLSLVSPATQEVILFHGMVVNLGGAVGLERRPPGMGVELFAIDPGTRAAWWDLVRFVREHFHLGVEPWGDAGHVASLMPGRGAPMLSSAMGPSPIGLRS